MLNRFSKCCLHVIVLVYEIMQRKRSKVSAAIPHSITQNLFHFFSCVFALAAFFLCLFILALFFMATLFEIHVHNLLINGALFLAGLLLLILAAHKISLYWNKKTLFAGYSSFVVLLGVYLSFLFNKKATVSFFILATFVLFAVLLFQAKFAKYLMPLQKIKIPGSLFLIFFVFLTVLFNQIHDRMFYGLLDYSENLSGNIWELKPSRVYGVNKDGYRGKLVDQGNFTNHPRLLFLGDSSTFGSCVKQDETYPATLDQLLAQSTDAKAAVINAGVPGYNLAEMSRFYQNFRPWKPTHVFIMAGEHFKHITRERSVFVPVIKPFRGLATLYGLVFRKVFKPKYNISQGENQEIWHTTLSAFVAQIRKDGATPVLLVYPSEEVDQPIQDILQTVSKNHRVPTIDLLELFRQNQELDLLRDEIHPSPLGNQLIANEIVHFMKNNGFLSLPSVNPLPL